MQFDDFGGSLTEQEVQDAFKKVGVNNVDNSNIFRTKYEGGHVSVFVEFDNTMGYIDLHSEHGLIKLNSINCVRNFKIDYDGTDMPLNNINKYLSKMYDGDWLILYTCPYHKNIVWCLHDKDAWRVERTGLYDYILKNASVKANGSGRSYDYR